MLGVRSYTADIPVFSEGCKQGWPLPYAVVVHEDVANVPSWVVTIGAQLHLSWRILRCFKHGHWTDDELD